MNYTQYAICIGIAFVIPNSQFWDDLLLWRSGPNGPTVYEILRRRRNTLNNQIRNGALRPCPQCAEFIKSEAKVCRFCGRDVPPVTSPADSR